MLNMLHFYFDVSMRIMFYSVGHGASNKQGQFDCQIALIHRTNVRYSLNLNPLLIITGSEITCVRVVGKCGVL